MRIKVAFFDGTKTILGISNTIRFCDDTWLGETPFAIQYPTLYNIVISRKLKRRYGV